MVKKIDKKIESLEKELDELQEEKRIVKREINLQNQNQQQKSKEEMEKRRKEEEQQEKEKGQEMKISKQKNEEKEESSASISTIEKIPVKYNQTVLKMFNSESVSFDYDFTNLIFDQFNKYYLESVPSDPIKGPLNDPPKIVLQQKILYPDFHLPIIHRVAAKGFGSDPNTIPRVSFFFFTLFFSILFTIFFFTYNT